MVVLSLRNFEDASRPARPRWKQVLEECDCLHFLMSSEMNPSGEKTIVDETNAPENAEQNRIVKIRRGQKLEAAVAGATELVLISLASRIWCTKYVSSEGSRNLGNTIVWGR